MTAEQKYYTSTFIVVNLTAIFYNEKARSVTLYAYCGNNPIMRTDKTGMYFDEDNEKTAQKLETKINTKIATLEKKGGNTERISELKQSLQDISNMRGDENTEYRYVKLGSKEARENRLNAPTTTMAWKSNDKGDNVVRMSYSTTGQQTHETRHGGDVARGNLVYNTTGGYGVSHEISAYRAQFAYDGKITYLPDFAGASSTIYNHKSDYSDKHQTITNINNINAGFVNSIINGYNMRGEADYLYSPNRTSVPTSIWNSH